MEIERLIIDILTFAMFIIIFVGVKVYTAKAEKLRDHCVWLFNTLGQPEHLALIKKSENDPTQFTEIGMDLTK